MRKITKKATLFLFIPLILSSICLPFLHNTIASAAADDPTLSYKNYSTIHLSVNTSFTYNKQTFPVNLSVDFVDKGPWDKTYQYTYSDKGCDDSTIDLGSPGATTGKLYLDVQDPYDTTQCVYRKYTLPIGNPDGGVFANWTSKTTITTAIGGYTLKQKSSSSEFSIVNTANLFDLNANCPPGDGCHIDKTEIDLTVSADNKTAKAHIFSDSYRRFGPNVSKTYDLNGVRLGGSPTSPATGDSGLPDQGGTTGDNSKTCESSGISLAWIMCPIINGISTAVDGIYGSIIVPFLKISPLEPGSGSGKPVYQAWSDLRILGNVFLVIALLIIVFGESVGGGLIDAYTAKKALPKILVAAILINLSYYICAFLVDVFNVLGSGLMNLLTHPFTKVPDFGIKLTGHGIVGNGGTGLEADGLGIAALVTGGFAAAAGGVATLGVLHAALLWFWAFVLLPALLIFIAILVTVFLRRALIIILVVISPVAFALYCLPNTEKYFKKWWDALLETLAVFPIIAVLFAAGKIAAIVIPETTGGIWEGFADIIAVVSLIVPLALIPFAFKLAGGIIGKVHETMNAYGKRGHQALLGNENDPYSWRNRVKYKMGDKWTQARERTVASGRKEGAGFIRRGYSRASNYGNLQAKRSMYNKQRSEMLQSQIATGDDSNIRDLFIAQDANTGQWYRRMDMQKGADGKLRAVSGASAVYKDAAIGKAAHDKSLNLYRGDQSAVQDALYYEWKKTSFNPGQMKNLEGQYGDVLKEHRFNNEEGAGMMKAVGFRHQGQSLASKYSSFKPQADGNWGWSVDHVGMAKEISHNIGTFQMQQQDQTTYDELAKGHTSMKTAMAADAVDANGIFTEGAYEGKSYMDVADAYDRIGRIADAVDPDQRVPGGGRQVAAPEHEGDQPQMSGYAGVSSAPVDVKRAAQGLVDTVRRNRGGPTPPPGQPPTPPDPLSDRRYM